MGPEANSQLRLPMRRSQRLSSSAAMSHNLQECHNTAVPSKRPHPDSASFQGGASQLLNSAENSKNHSDSALLQLQKDGTVLGYLHKRLLDAQNAVVALEEANKNVTIVERERDTIKAEVDELTEKAADLLDELHRAQNETSAATREMQNLRQTFQTEHRIAKDTAKESSDKYNVVITEIGGLKSQLKDSVSEKTSLGAENASLKEQIVAITAEKESQAIEYLSLPEQVAATVAKKDKQVTELQKQLDTMKSENERLSEGIETLVADSAGLVAEKTDLRTDKIKLEAEVKELEKAYKDALHHFDVYQKRMKALAKQM